MPGPIINLQTFNRNKGVPINVFPPVISGTAQVGQTLSTSTGVWTNNPTSFTYQWFTNGGAINFATASTYVPVAANVGTLLTVTVTAININGSSAAKTSAATLAVAPVGSVAPVNITPPTIPTTAQVGQPITATTGTWMSAPTSFSYQWFRNGVAITGATASTYIPVVADIGSQLTVSVTASNSVGPSIAVLSNATSAVIPASTATITIGWTPATTPTFGQTTGIGFLNAASGLSGAGGVALSSTATIQSISVYCTTAAGGSVMLGFYDNAGAGGAPGNLKASTSSTLLVAGWNTIPVITQASLPAGTYWFVEIMNDNVTALGHGTGTAGHIYVGGQPFSMPAVAPAFPNTSADAIAIYATLSTAAAISVPVNTALPVISGNAQVGQTLTASTGTWTNSPTSFTYQWNRGVLPGTAIVGAVNQTYVPVAADVGNPLTVTVVANNGALSAPSMSNATNAVIAAALTVPVNTSIPTISGTAQVGQTLTASTGLWTNSPTSFAYQWLRNGVAISGATASTYVPVTADILSPLAVSVTASNSAGPSATAAMSLLTAAVTAAALTTITVGWTPTTTPTFGQATGIGFLNAASGLPTAGGVVLSSTATIQSISVYCTTASGGNLILGFYDNAGAGGTPGNLKASTASQTLVAGWNTIPVITQVSLNPGTYWFAFIMNDNVTALGNGTGTAGHIFTGSQPFSMPAVAPAFPNTSAAAIAIYATLSTVASTGVPINTVLPIITGTAQVGQTLSASTGTWTNNPTLPFIYQWYRGSPLTAITGATAQTYIPVAADVGNGLTVSVIAGNSFGSSAQAFSQATSAVAAATAGVPVNSTVPIISGQSPPQVGGLLTASTGTWTNNPTNFFYQWNSSGTGTSGGFSTAGGKIIGPNGQPWIGRGMKFAAPNLPSLISAPPAITPMTTLFPGINIVLIFWDNPRDMSFATFQIYVNALTSHGIVVVIQDDVEGEFGLNQPISPLTGSQLTTSVNLMASYASFYINNPYVWGCTMNEPNIAPGGTLNQALTDTMRLAYYNGWRSTGNKNMFVFDATGNPQSELFPSNVAAQYAGTTNVVWDTHYYNWMSTPQFSNVVANNLSAIAATAATFSSVTNASGPIPVTIMEYGDSTTNTSPDAGWQASVQAVNTAPSINATCAYTWNNFGEPFDQLGNVNGNPASGLSAFGTLVESYISTGPSPPTPPGASAGPITGAIGSTYSPVTGDITHQLSVSVTANNGANSLPATSLLTSAVVAAVAGVPVNTVLPTITGTPAVGTRLTVSNGTWTNNPTFTYQWQSAAPTPDITAFAGGSGSNVIIGGKSYTTENANQAWSITKPDSQTLVFQVRPGDVWSADVGRAGPPNRSEIDGFAQQFPPGTPITVSYNFNMTSATVRTDAAGITVGQFHNNDTVALTGGTSPPFEIDLQPLDFMSIYVANLASSPAPTGTTFFGGTTVNGVNLNYYQAYADHNPIVRGHNYAINIQIKYTVAGDNSGFVKVFRDGVQIVNCTGQLGFGYSLYWKEGIYGTVTNATQIAQYQNLLVVANPAILGTGNTYVPVAADVGNSIACTVVATNGAQSASAIAPAVGPVVAASSIPQNTAIPVITGNTTVGSTLTTTTGSWSITPTSFTIQWLSGGANATGAGATTTTYTAVTADIGHQLQVSIVAHNGTGNDSAMVFSALTNAVSTSSTPRTASLLGIFGISGHIGNYNGYVVNGITIDNSHTVSDAQYLGIGMWRDGISGNSAATNTIIQGLVNAGISYIGLPWLPTDVTYPGNISGAKTILAMGPTPQGTRALLAVEGPNEPKISTFQYPQGNSGTTWQGVAVWQSGWHAAVHADSTLNGAGVFVSTPTLVGQEPDNWGLQFLTVPTPAPGGELSAAGTVFADIYDFHLYPMYTGHCQTISPGFDSFQGQMSFDFVNTGSGFAGSSLATVNANIRICTEFGYNIVASGGGAITGGGIIVDVPTQGKNMLTGLMNAWVEGLSAICMYTIYPFFDGNEIFNGPGNPKVSAQYIHNFTAPLIDTAATAKTFATGAVTYTISGLPSTGKSLLFQKSNLTYEVIVWNNVENWNNGAGAPITIGGTSVTVVFSASMTTTHVYDCTVQATPIATGSGTTVTFTLKDYPMVIEGIP